MLSVTLYNVYTMTENVSEMGQLDKVKVRSLIMFKKATIMFAKKLRISLSTVLTDIVFSLLFPLSRHPGQYKCNTFLSFVTSRSPSP